MRIIRSLILIIGTLVMVRTLSAQTFTVDTLINNGSKNNRINLVFLGDGYTATQQTKFINDVTVLVDSVFKTFPFTVYKSFFNVYAVQVISQDSGAKHPHTASDCPALTVQPIATPNNYLGSTFDYEGIHRFLMPNQTTVDNVLAANLPQYTCSCVVVNTPYFGGAQEGNIAVCSSSDPTSAQILEHELGHSLAGVGDEYAYGSCNGVEEWNATAQTDPTQVRWKAWFANGVANPTSAQQNTGDGCSACVGLYLGANYCTTGWYRPEANCKMRALGYPYCNICVERFVYAFSYFVNLIDSHQPSSSISLGSGQSQNFSATFLTPSPNSLKITWTLDKTVVASNVTSYLVNANNISAGTHTLVLTVVDSTYHSRTTMPSYSTTWTITNGAASTVTLNTFSPLCFNSPAFTLTGGLPSGGTYSGTGVSNGQFNPAVSGSGNFTITYTVAGVSASQVITVNALPNLTLATTSNSICTGSNTTLSAAGAGAYSWSPSTGLSSVSSSSVTATPSTTTTYTVTGVSNGCSKTLTSVITVNPIPPVYVPSASICSGSSASLSASGATTYTWLPSTGLSSSVAASVTASPPVTTTYTVTGTSNGCSNSIATVVTVTPVPAVTVSPNSSICNGSSASLSASGATSYTWSPSAGLNSTITPVVTAAPATTTTYTVTGTSNGCSKTASVTVTVGSVSLIVSPNSTICSGNSLPLSASGATTYTWSPAAGLSAITGNSVTASPSATTTYTVTGVSGSCSNSIAMVVTVAPPPVVTVSPNASVCNGSSTTLSASGATSYTWSPSSGLNSTIASAVTATPATTTTYTVTGTSNGCSKTASVTVTVGALNLTASSGTTICTGTSAPLSASGATTYSWSPAAGLSATAGNSVTASPSATTTYTVTGVSGSCTNSAAIVVTVAGPPVIGISSNATVCSGNATTISASGAATYSWSPAVGLSSTTGSSITAAPSSTTTYTVTGTLNGCSKTNSSVITVLPLPSLSLSPNASICSGGSVILTASGASAYNWFPATGLNSSTTSSVTANPSATTTYFVTGTLNGCSVISSVSVTITTGSLSITTSPNSTICSGSSTALTASGATSFLWSPAAGLSSTTGTTVTADPTVATTYTVTGSSGSCSQSKTITVGVNPAPNLAVSSNVSICTGSSTTLTASGATSYTWSPATGLNNTTAAAVSANPASTTNYTVTGVANGCSKSLVINVDVEAIPVISTSPASTVCSGSSANLIALGATTYSWSPATGLTITTGYSIFATPAATTTYTVTGANKGCTRTQTVIVNVNPAPAVTVTGSASVCQGTGMQLSATGATTYSWLPVTGLNLTSGVSVTATPSATTTYSVTGTTGGCSKTLTTIVSVNTPTTLVTSVTNPVANNSNGAINLNVEGGNSPYLYHWSNSATTQNISNIPAGSYTVSVTSGACVQTNTTQLIATSICDTTAGGISFIAITSSSLFITWDAVSGCYEYVVHIRPAGTTTWTGQAVLAPNTAVSFSGLLASTKYEMQIETECNSTGTSVSRFTSSRYFTTLAARMEDEEVAAQDSAALASGEIPLNLTLYPNPNNGEMNLLFNGTQDEELTLDVYDMLGRIVYHEVLSSYDGANVKQLNLHDIPAGNYMVVATRKEDRVVKKFMKF